ncbi:MAG TPA: acyl-CoA dehydrogenase family protein [Caulobacteraceae bacterium]|nr:acyl-CoA dehydrogenase family protein [Caulobacteraceae bacterium]
MNLDLSLEDCAFREEVRDFLAANLTSDLRVAAARATSVFQDKSVSLAWQKILRARGWAAPSWPAEYGGPGWSEMQRHIFSAESARAGAPGLAPMGLRMVGPVIIGMGSEAQKAHYLPRILSGEDYWCQGYSEPQAGSDLAALQLSAEADGDHYVLNGSKIWTTHAHMADRMFCLVRTRREGKPQAGITFLLLDMSTPGLSVRPIITLAGDHEVNQVFFDNVRTPQSGRVGEENDGWRVAKYLLQFERGGGSAPGLRVALDRLARMAAEEPGDDGRPLLRDPTFRAALASASAALDAVEAAEQRVLAALRAGDSPGPASSMLKTVGTEMMQRLDELALDAIGPWAAADQGEFRAPGSNTPGVGPAHALTVTARYLNDRAASIYGGSNEIQRDILARQLLGL